MKILSVSQIVKQAPEALVNEAFAEVRPDESYDLELSSSIYGPPMGAPDRSLGERFHAAVATATYSSGAISPEFLPFVQVLSDWLHDEGVSKIYSEWQFFSSKKVRGICDMLLKGGRNSRGIVEIKLVNFLPEDVSADDQLQLGLYVCAAAERFRDYGHFWGAVAYVCPSAQSIRIFEWSSMAYSCQAANRVLLAS